MLEDNDRVQTYFIDFNQSGRLEGQALRCFLRSFDPQALVTFTLFSENGHGTFRESFFWQDDEGRKAIQTLLEDVGDGLARVECRYFDEWGIQHVYALVNINGHFYRPSRQRSAC